MKLLRMLVFLSFPLALSQDLRIDCDDYDFCNTSHELYSEFVCEQICEEQHNRMINGCSPTNRQFYQSITYTQAISFYNTLINYLNATTITLPIELIDSIFSYNTQSSVPIDFTYISENIYNHDWWDGGNDEFNIGENYKYGWGSILINNDQSSNENIAIHVNHPLHDVWSDMIAGYIFESHLQPKWMISAGAHRYSWVDVGYTPPPNCPVDCESNFGADVARQEEDCFGSSYTTLFQTYHESLSDNIESLFSLSIHSFSSESLDMNDTLLSPYGDIAPSFIITNGNDGIDNDCIPPDQTTSTIYHYLNDYFSNTGNFNTVDSNIYDLYIDECNQENIAIIVQQEINCDEQNSINGTSCSDSGASSFSQYGGYKNPQGRYTNGYYDASINVGNPQIIDDIWMQIEISDCIRNDIRLYEKTASIISKAVEDCKVNGDCKVCDEYTPCSSYLLTGKGVNYSNWDYTCSTCINGIIGDCNCDGIISNSDIYDLNCDGVVNLIDIMSLLNQVLDNNCSDGDVNSDGICNIIDILILVNYILNP